MGVAETGGEAEEDTQLAVGGADGLEGALCSVEGCRDVGVCAEGCVVEKRREKVVHNLASSLYRS